jgi:hypothetical protein
MKDSLGRSREDGHDGRRHANHPPPYPVNPGEVISRLGPGRSLPERDQAALGERFGHDFSRVRLHDDDRGHIQASALGADAFAVGEHLAFRRGRYDPATLAGQELLGHEAQHLIEEAGSRGRPATSRIQLKKGDILDDITVEMVGQPFTLSDAAGSAPNVIPKNAKVTVVDWKGLGANATVSAVVAGKTVQADVSKVLLDPDLPGVAGIRKYSVGTDKQQDAVVKSAAKRKKQQDTITAWQSKQSSFKKKPEAWQAQMTKLQEEQARLDKELEAKEQTLSRMLVQQTMYNRFDPMIKRWVDHYNTSLKPKKKLDPSIVKSMLFQETRMGTHGEHLELPPYDWADSAKHPIRSRFNLMQAVDSSGEQQLVMIEEMAPAVYNKHKLDELKKEHQKKGKTEAELWAWNGGKLGAAIQEYMAVAPGTGLNLMGTSKDLYLDYEYWIRTGVRWLFYKFSITNDWDEAVRAFNGRPDKKKAPKAWAKSMKYKADVLGRAGSTTDLDVSGL